MGNAELFQLVHDAELDEYIRILSEEEPEIDWHPLNHVPHCPVCNQWMNEVDKHKNSAYNDYVGAWYCPAHYNDNVNTHVYVDGYCPLVILQEELTSDCVLVWHPKRYALVERRYICDVERR